MEGLSIAVVVFYCISRCRTIFSTQNRTSRL